MFLYMKDNTISEKESNAIVIIRATAMFSIVLCHLFQAYNILSIGSVLNIGVQVFLVMSGYLYGKKQITCWSQWYKKRFLKLYIPFTIVWLSVFLFHIIFKTDTIKWYNIVNYLTNLQGLRLVFDITQLHVSGLNHLWFMTAIMFAYFSTPVLQSLKKYSQICLVMILIFFAFFYFYLTPRGRLLFGVEWFWLYAFGYFFANISIKARKIYICLFALIYLYALAQIKEPRDIIYLWSILGRRHHCALGILLFSTGVTYLKCFTNKSKIMPVFKWFDKYSYFIYLTHFTVMVGTLSLANITNYLFVNVLLMILASAILTYLLVIANNFITNKIQQRL